LRTCGEQAWSLRAGKVWVHYSLSKSADPIVATIEDATTHVLGHVEVLKKDAARLEKRTAIDHFEPELREEPLGGGCQQTCRPMSQNRLS
jgi:hypothetical protein